MLKIVVGGQLNKREIEKQIKELGGDEVEVTVKQDLNAVMDIQNNKADYYVGACETGSGGALAMAISLLGKNKTATLATPSSVMSEEEIEKAIDEGTIAFGFTATSSKNILNVLIPALLNRKK